MPKLAEFTSNTFYADEGGLRIMTEVGKNVHRQCFQSVRVNGKRSESDKVVPEEVNKLVDILKGIIRQKTYLTDPGLSSHGFTDTHNPTIGILSFLTDQRDFIREKVADEFDQSELLQYDVLVGTPEEFQGNERNIMIITLGLDGSGKWGRVHYQNPNRFNVATSRAINFAYLIYAGIPAGATLIRDYLRHFGVRILPGEIVESSTQPGTPIATQHRWRYDPKNMDSEFEQRVAEHLNELIARRAPGDTVKLYNQVPSCNKFLDFVLYNEVNKKCCAIEVDGKDHFDGEGRKYSEAHLERVAILKRAGWDIIHLPYYKWYKNGWLCDTDDQEFRRMVNHVDSQLYQILGLTG
jgi:very-short-patch-repair endonuclease